MITQGQKVGTGVFIQTLLILLIYSKKFFTNYRTLLKNHFILLISLQVALTNVLNYQYRMKISSSS